MDRSHLLEDLVGAVDQAEPGRPLYLRLVRAVSRLVENGALLPGEKLPSTRDVGEALGWHRSTVVQAYQTLCRQGVVVAGVGRGTFVAEPMRPARTAGAFPWTEVYPQDEGVHDIETILAQDVPFPVDTKPIRLAGAIPDPELFPVDELRTVMLEVLDRQGAAALGYGPTEGLVSLRTVIAERLASQGIPASPDRILVVQGSQQGLDLVARRLLSPGDRVAVESPSYANAISLFRGLGVHLVPIPMDDEGMNPDVLESVASRQTLRMIYSMPSFQNPTGLTQSLERRRKLLGVATRWGVPVLEDHFDAELRFRGKALPTLKQLDGQDQVLLLGTFSKILFPGLRVGWLLLPEAIYESVSRLVHATSLSVSALTQETLAEFCRRGLLDRHLARTCPIYASRRNVLLDAMAEHFPGQVTWTRPEDGGMTLWVTLPEGMNAVSITLEARKRGVRIAPGPMYFIEGGHGNFSLSSTAEPEDRIREGVRILGEILHDALPEAGARRGKWESEATPLV